MTERSNYRTRIITDLQELAHCGWDALLANAPESGAVFLKSAFLGALQASGCVGNDTGWQPHFVVLMDPEDGLVAGAPLWIKDHSYGEYVFDWAWADAYHRHGLPYYPKGLIAVPFTPVPGPRLLAISDATRSALISALDAQCEALGLSGLHVLFPHPNDALALTAAGLMARQGVQFHWENPGWRSFDDYLAALAQPKRKKIRAERRKVAQAGVRVRMLAGQEIEPAHWQHFARCYKSTYAQHHSTPYLNRAFFQAIAAGMPEHLLMALAEHDNEPVAAALLFRDARTLYGRYWGAVQAFDSLHFEASYYAPIEWAIAQGIERFEGGAQGEHKMARGFMPQPTCSFHRLAHPAFADAVERFLVRERGGIDAYLDELQDRSPLRSG